MNVEDSRPRAVALPLLAAMHAWLPRHIVDEYERAEADLRRNGRWVYRKDAQGRDIVEPDATSDFNRPLLLRMREAQDAAEAAFLGMLRGGRLVAWAREGSPLAPLRRIPGDAWTTLRLAHVAEGRAQGPGVELFGIHVAAAAAPAEPAPAAPSPPEPAQGERTDLQPEDGAGPKLPRTNAKQAYSPEALAAWFLLRVKTWPKGEPPPSEADCIAAAQAYFADAPGRDPIREIRRQKTPESWRKRGPKRRR
jgi:hypothetical protein